MTLFIDTPTYVVYHELILTSKEYMTQVTAVDAYWLGASYLSHVFYKEARSSQRVSLLQPSWDPYSTPSRKRVSTNVGTGARQIASSPKRQSWRRRWRAGARSESFSPPWTLSSPCGVARRELTTRLIGARRRRRRKRSRLRRQVGALTSSSLARRDARALAKGRVSRLRHGGALASSGCPCGGDEGFGLAV